MARPKEFNRQDALGKAIEVFWTHGYQATTMTGLRRAMGIGRQSLYDTFGDKKELFAEALARYVSFNDGNVAALLNNDDGMAGIRSLLNSRVRMLSSGARRGCLMMNTCVELAPHDAEVADQIQSGLATMRLGFEAALNRALDQGKIRLDANVRELAVFLNAQVAGMTVMAKNQASKQELQAVADQALRSLR